MTGPGTTIHLDYAPPTLARRSRILAWIARHRRRLIAPAAAVLGLLISWFAGACWEHWTIDDYTNFCAVRHQRISIGSMGWTWSRAVEFRHARLAQSGDPPLLQAFPHNNCLTCSGRDVERISFGHRNSGRMIYCAHGIQPALDSRRFAFEYVAALPPEQRNYTVLRKIFAAVDAQLPRSAANSYWPGSEVIAKTAADAACVNQLPES